MTDRDVYIKAAILIDNGRQVWSCNAIWHPASSDPNGTQAHRSRYRVAFGFPAEQGVPDDFQIAIQAFDKPKALRVWCLLMMAAACEDL